MASLSSDVYTACRPAYEVGEACGTHIAFAISKWRVQLCSWKSWISSSHELEVACFGFVGAWLTVWGRRLSYLISRSSLTKRTNSFWYVTAFKTFSSNCTTAPRRFCQTLNAAFGAEIHTSLTQNQHFNCMQIWFYCSVFSVDELHMKSPVYTTTCIYCISLNLKRNIEQLMTHKLLLADLRVRWHTKINGQVILFWDYRL